MQRQISDGAYLKLEAASAKTNDEQEEQRATATCPWNQSEYCQSLLRPHITVGSYTVTQTDNGGYGVFATMNTLKKLNTVR